MVEIYRYDLEVHERYARDAKDVESFLRQYHIPPSRSGIIAGQTRILDYVPKHPAIVLLLQTFQRISWARFLFPKDYFVQRFFSPHIVPSLGSTERQVADIQRVEAYITQATRGRRVRPKEQREDKEGRRQKNEDEEILEEGEAIVDLLDDGIKSTNQEIDYIFSRIHQFVQA